MAIHNVCLYSQSFSYLFFFFQAEDGIRDVAVTGVQTCALPISAVVNAIAERYVAVAADLKRQRLTELTKILDEQLSAAQKSLQDAEAALQSYRVATITLPSDRPVPAPSGGRAGVASSGENAQDPVFGNFFSSQFERDQAHRDRETLERVLRQMGDSGLSAEALAVVGSVQQNADLAAALKELNSKQADLRTLRYRYSDQYPPVQRLQGEIATLKRQTIPTLARGLSGELAARDAQLPRRLDTDSRNLRAIPPRAIEEARLRRGVTLAENLYTTLQSRFEEARLAEASTVPDVRILDHAVVPQRPVRNTRSEEHTSELQSRLHLVCRLLLEKKKKTRKAQSVGLA